MDPSVGEPRAKAHPARAPRRAAPPAEGQRAARTRARPGDVLLIGNSFSFDLGPPLRELLRRADPAWSEVQVRSYARPAYTLSQHLADARQEGSPLDQLLRARGLSVVVLQDQSQLPAFDLERSEDAQASLAAVRPLHERVRAARAHAVFFQTWGYVRGEPQIGGFEQMQDLLGQGYARYRRETGGRAAIAPVGEAFRRVRQGERAGQLAFGHADLYAPDGRHPSRAGRYLSAAVLAATISGRPVRGCEWSPANLPAAAAAQLRAVADEVALR